MIQATAGHTRDTTGVGKLPVHDHADALDAGSGRSKQVGEVSALRHRLRLRCGQFGMPFERNRSPRCSTAGMTRLYPSLTLITLAVLVLAGCAAPYPNPLDRESDAADVPAIAGTPGEVLTDAVYRRVGVTQGFAIFVARGTLAGTRHNCVLWQSASVGADGVPEDLGAQACATGTGPVVLDDPQHLSLRYEPRGAAPGHTTSGWIRLTPFVEVRVGNGGEGGANGAGA